MTHQYSIEQVPEHLDKIIKEVEQGDSVQITRQQERVAVILSAAEYDRLLQNKPGFGKALEKFRQELIEEGIEIDPVEVFRGVRDRSSGREVIL